MTWTTKPENVHHDRGVSSGVISDFGGVGQTARFADPADFPALPLKYSFDDILFLVFKILGLF